MKFKTILKNHDEFESAVEYTIIYAQEVLADLPYRSRISTGEKSILLEALLLKICALWGKFVEEELVYATYLNTKKLSQLMGVNLNTKLTTEITRALIFSDTYRSFRGIDDLIHFSKKVIEGQYNPFTQISLSQKKDILFTHKIRNYLSHYSGYSRRALFSAYKERYNYIRFLEPGKFLLKDKGKRFEDLSKNFKMTSIHMKKIFKGGTTP